MDGSRWVLVILPVLLLSTGGSILTEPLILEPQSVDSGSSPYSDSEWFRADPSESSYELRTPTGLLHSPYGPFDPLVDPVPLGPENLYDPFALQRTGMLLVQSSSSDMTAMFDILEKSGLDVIEIMPEYSVVARLYSDDHHRIIDELVADSSIRWAGELPIAWRVSPYLSSIAGIGSQRLDLDIIPAPDLDKKELLSLSEDMELISENSVERAICDLHICQPKNVDAAWIPILAMDGRILRINPAAQYSVQNSNASLIGGLQDARLSSGLSLNGSGEVLAVSDTGLDDDHGDFGNRIRAIYNQFGPDNSHADSNTGHGTHVSATLLGDGSGDSNAVGMVPGATFHFYQLEADSSGMLARWGSLYEMFSHSWNNNARIQTNSWGNQNLAGDYSSDSRSADSFISDYPRFLVLFSAGDLSSGGITPPGTAKNVLTVGASSTGSYGSTPEGVVASFSSMGVTSDGRIKPDIVAPGVAICSARAQEAVLAEGGSCSSASIEEQTPLYMSLNGSSMATSVAAGAAAMVRQYLREAKSISEPRSDFIRALLINGAEDLGANDIPNPSEGWGQLDLENSLFPSNSDQDLNLLYDYSRELLPGHSFVYTFNVNGDYGLDATIVWNDPEGSAVANQSASRLVNDLDLRAVSPDGTTYFGNHFNSGFSVSGGSEDRLNNVERIRIPAGSPSGTWSIIVGHAGGSIQDFAMVLSGLGNEVIHPDLSVFEGSLSTSIDNPLQGDTILIEAAWKNQAAAPTGTYSIEVEDLTSGSIIHTSSRPSLSGGLLDSVSFPHSFSTTGTHQLELRLDSDSAVQELNDESTGIENNRYLIEVNVSQIGVRLTPLMEDGSLPANPAQLSQAMSRTLDPRHASWVLFDLQMRNEGTSEISVGLSVSPVQLLGDDGILYPPQDDWWKLLNETGPWTLAPYGQPGDSLVVTLNLSDMDTDLSSDSEAVYALPGTFVSDLTLYDKNAPTVSHSIRLNAVVQRVEGLYTIVAGTEGLSAEPGDTAVFTLSIKNTGNGPTQYSISCETTDRWTITIGDSESSQITLDPLSRLQFLPMPIRIRVPSAVDGFPPAGFTQSIECITSSTSDPNLQTSENATLNVLESLDFSTQIFDSEGNALGPQGSEEPRVVINDDIVITDLVVNNEGNVPLDFVVEAFSSRNSWPIQISLGQNVDPEGISFSIASGSHATVTISTIVPFAAEMGDTNTLTIRTTRVNGPIVTMSTLLAVQEVAILSLSWGEILETSLGTPGIGLVSVQNIGNVDLDISLTMGTLPTGWSGGFLSGRQFTMGMNSEAVIEVVVDLPSNLPIGLLADKVTVIIEASTPAGEVILYTVEIGVSVLPSIWMDISSEFTTIENIGEDGKTFEITISNLGNTHGNSTLSIHAPENWKIDANAPTSIGPGESSTIPITATPDSDASSGLTIIVIEINSSATGSDDVSITGDSLEISVSKSRNSGRGGLGGILDSLGLPDWSMAVIMIAILSATTVYAIKMRRSSSAMMSPDEELIPEGSALLSGSLSERRAAALETSSSGEVMTGGVSDEDIQAAIAQSSPSALPPTPDGTPPLPLSGLPEGWTMEQWASYGHLWWEQNKP
ncbi:MAG: S8 family serine peptidase [Candidatus Thalassarchaeum sp.]